MIPPSEYFINTALPLLLVFEGGLVDDPVDHGGRTNKGIIQREYNHFRIMKGLLPQDVANISDAEVQEIYYTEYWQVSHCDKMPEKLSTAVFDTSVNMGVGAAARMLQQTIGVTVDGIIGSITLGKLSQCNPDQIANKFLDTKSNFYNQIIAHDLTQEKFRDGWFRRLGFVCDYVNGVKTLDQIRSQW